jgi:hypothetical protein
VIERLRRPIGSRADTDSGQHTTRHPAGRVARYADLVMSHELWAVSHALVEAQKGQRIGTITMVMVNTTSVRGRPTLR